MAPVPGPRTQNVRTPGSPGGHRRARTTALGLIALLSALLVGCAGCWGSRDIEERAFVLMLGLDTSEEGVRVSAQVAVNERMAGAGAGGGGDGGGGGGGGGGGEAVIVVHHDSESTSAGVNLLQDSTAHPVYLGHLKVVVVGQEFARQRGISEAIETLLRDPEVRGRVWIVQAGGRAEDLLRAKPKAERIPAAFIENLLDVGLTAGHAPDSRLTSVAVRLDTPGYNVLLPILRVEEDSMEITGASVFRGDRAVSEIDHPLIHDYSLITGAPAVGVYSAPSPRGNGRLYAEIMNPRTRVSVKREAGEVVIRLRIIAEAEALEDTGHGGGGAPAWADVSGRIPRVERALGDEIARRVTDLIRKVQEESGADVFGFVRHAGSLKFQDGEWDEVFPRAKVQVEATVRLRRFGMGEA
ncbi:MAG: Ger(x)C family spore germination protein [Ignavibacteriales bacterium]